MLLLVFSMQTNPTFNNIFCILFQIMAMNELPNEILTKIFKSMDICDALKCTQVSKSWKQLILSSIIYPKLMKTNRGLDYKIVENSDSNLMFSIHKNQVLRAFVHEELIKNANRPVDWTMSFIHSKTKDTQRHWFAKVLQYLLVSFLRIECIILFYIFTERNIPG